MERPKSGVVILREEGDADRLKHFRTAESSGGFSAPSPFPDSWKKEKVCFLCQEKVGTGRGDTRRRRGCKFCAHALCEKCAPIKSMHPLTSREERICVSCFKGMLEHSLRSEFSDDLARKNQELRSLEEQLSTEVDARAAAEKAQRAAEAELQRLQTPMSSDLPAQFETEVRRAESAEHAFATLQTDHFRLQQEAKFERENFETSVLREKQNADKMRKVLIFKSAELSGAKSTIEALRKQVSDLEKQLEGESGREDVLKQARESHAAEKLELQKQLYAANELLRAKTMELERVNSAIKDSQDSSQASLRLLQAREQEAVSKLAAAEAEIKALSNRVDAMEAADETEQWKSLCQSLQGELDSLQEQLRERDSLLSLAKDDVLRENAGRIALEDQLHRRPRMSDLDADLELLKVELSKRVEQWKMFQEEVRVVLTTAQEAEHDLRQQLSDEGVREIQAHHHDETQKYKEQLENYRQAILKFDGVIKMVQEKLQLEQQVLSEKEQEVETLKQLLENHGIAVPTMTADQESSTDLNTKLKVHEETIEKLNAQMKEYKEEMKKLKNDKFRRSRPSALQQRNSSQMPPLSQDPCDCAVF